MEATQLKINSCRIRRYVSDKSLLSPGIVMVTNASFEKPPEALLTDSPLYVFHKCLHCLQSYTEHGLIGLVRPPHIHSAPPLVITEDEMLDGFERNDKALYALDEALGF